MRIALVSEGTYPYAMGGVSVWCDQLIRGLSEHEWEFVALTGDGHERALWERPDNLRDVRSIPLWSARHPAAGSDTPPEEFLAAYRGLCEVLVRPLDDEDLVAAQEDRLAFTESLRDLFMVMRGVGTEPLGYVSSDPAIDALVEAWQRHHEQRISLRDALETATLLDHLLRPLFARPVEADIVHSSMNGLAMLVGFAAKWAHGTPLIMSEHGTYLRERYLMPEADGVGRTARFLRLNLFRLLAGAGYLVSDALAPHSRYNRRWQLQNGGDPARMWTMYNGVEPELFPPARHEPDDPTIVFLGRIDPIKDLHTLLRAFATVRTVIPRAKLRVFGGAAGNEEYLASCRQLAAELRLADGVAFEGPAPTPVGAYHSGSLVALSSISEGFPYTVVEAMACGRTVVCTNVGGVVEAVADAGLVVPPKDSTAFADACIELLLDDSRRRHLATRARDRVLGSFTLEASLNAYRDLYTRVGEGRGSRTAEELEPVLASVASAAGRAPVTRRPRLEAAS